MSYRGTAPASWRKEIGRRTRAALARRRAEGVRLGRPRSVTPEVVARIVALRQAGHSLSAIAGELEASGVATARGGARWYPSTVAAVLRYAEPEAA